MASFAHEDKIAEDYFNLMYGKSRDAIKKAMLTGLAYGFS